MMTDWPRWICIYTEPRLEVRTKWGLDAIGIENFLPMSKMRSHKRGGTDHYRPLFNRYLFARVGMDQWVDAARVRGVASVLCNDFMPMRVPDAAIADIRRAVALGIFDERRSSRLAPGDVVRLVNGPFAQFIGTVKQLRGHDRVLILLQLFKSLRQIETPLDGLEQIMASSPCLNTIQRAVL